MSFKTSAQKRVMLQVRATKMKIYPTSGQGLFNRRCHQNAVQYQHEKGGTIHEVIYIDSGSPYLHYINKVDNTFIEATLGVFCTNYEYYEIREVGIGEYLSILHTFDRGLAFWLESSTNWFTRKFIDRVV